jgi:hypothetical protein
MSGATDRHYPGGTTLHINYLQITRTTQMTVNLYTTVRIFVYFFLMYTQLYECSLPA